MKTYSWLVRREFWENRAIWIIPLLIGAALVLGALFGRVDIGVSSSSEGIRSVSGTALFAFGAVFFAVMNLYATWYLVECLHADRKDRSILFWKSLPISDTAMVLAKLFTGLVAIPLVYFLAADVSTLLMAFIVSVRARTTFGSSLWQPDLWLQLQALWMYLIVTTAVWYLPFTGYLLVISAWARRAVFLWSLLLPLALYLVERWFFGTHVLGTLMQERTFGYLSHAFREGGQHAWMTTLNTNDTIPAPASVWRLLDPVGFGTSVATWVGIMVGIAFIAAAIQLRLRRTDL
jgi:ABC-2 type transport system permease protein